MIQHRGFRRVWWVPPLPMGARVLEIGPGEDQRFIQWARRERDWHVVGMGSETDPIERVPLEGPWDAVVMWQVIEHLIDPFLVLQRVREQVVPNGYLVLSTPNAASVERWCFLTRWDGYTDPGHRHFFTPATLELLLQKTGFRVEKVLHQRVLKNWHLPSVIELIGGTMLAALHLSGRITVVARPA